ncbi:MAG: molybdopterin-guanine dinucleotide biosynthesis protein B [Pirellulales bacterium]
MQRLHIIGRKNSGKTTLMVDLVRHLTKLGYRVGTVKHTHHDHELDTPGKDSHRHREAGATAIGILSPAMSALFWPTSPDACNTDDYTRFLDHFSGCDLVLVEGHSQTAGPKIEVWRAANTDQALAATDSSILAVVTDDPLEVSTPVWKRSDVPELAKRVLALVGTP